MDARQRESAIRPDGSYLVQAPAGSGKTSLLTQRYLRLLARVNEPEEILAITFTRKAAAEMRGRVLGELRQASSGGETAGGHARETRELALAALARDRELGWQVLDSPRRLRIQTIDAFEASLVGRLPTLSRLGIAPAVSTRPAPLYAAAVREALRSMAAGDSRESLIDLLCLFDNNLESASRSLLTLLEKRDQWLPAMGANPLGEGGPDALRAALEENLRLLIEPDLERLRDTAPGALDAELVWLARAAASQLESGHALAEGLASLSGWPETSAAGLARWRVLGKWLLTNDGTLRKTITKREGFPTEEKLLKQRMGNFLARLALEDGFVAALSRVRELPDPFYTDGQWRVLEALFRFLRALLPELHVQFALRRETDFAEVALRATSALESSPGIPTLLAERLDAQIQHLLVDEFQDTSALQMLLVRKLTENWTPGDGRTLFLVGDPMQSIYGWRNARVELFLRTWEGRGAGLPPLRTLQLQRNFRSRRSLIETFNAWLRPHFPEAHDSASGAVAYADAYPDPAEEETRADRVQCHAFLSDSLEPEAEWIAAEIARLRRNEPDPAKPRKIGVLFRKGANANVVGRALSANGQRFQAIDVEPLGSLPAVQDLRAMWNAIESPENRLAWLSVLRAPWNALTLSELESLTRSAKGTATLSSVLRGGALDCELSGEARMRLRRTSVLFEEAMEWRGRLPAAALLQSLWLRCGAERYYADARSRMAAKQFLRLLNELDEADQLKDAEALEEALSRLYAPPDPSAPDTLQLLTIHKAKGLEFDVVFLPYLNAGRGRGETPPLSWEEVPLDGDEADEPAQALVIAARHAAGEPRSPISAMLHDRRGIREEHERLRVLYVALTRAKEELHLLATIDPKMATTVEELQPKRDSYLGRLWPQFEGEFARVWDARSKETPSSAESPAPYPMLRRLAAAELPELAVERGREAAAASVGRSAPPSSVFETAETAAGTVFHRFMERAGSREALVLAASNRAGLLPLVLDELQRLLPAEPRMEEVASRVLDALEATARSSIGEWVFHPEHREVRSEQTVGFFEDGKWKTARIDRLFRDAAKALHVVDFKLVEAAVEEPARFLREQRAVYEEQGERYARLLQRERAEPVTVTLYFPLQDLREQWIVAPLTRTA
ncbi:MAG: UvrD-helicase domain-containing protein [Bryobacterales bacterium]|nr:UvrD-helicase domain-containing protein [Bryobacterales bacterium]